MPEAALKPGKGMIGSKRNPLRLNLFVDNGQVATLSLNTLEVLRLPA
jgi:hypothetical protein